MLPGKPPIWHADSMTSESRTRLVGALLIAFIAWIGGFLWLCVEWIRALVRRRRAEWAEPSE